MSEEQQEQPKQQQEDHLKAVDPKDQNPNTEATDPKEEANSEDDIFATLRKLRESRESAQESLGIEATKPAEEPKDSAGEQAGSEKKEVAETAKPAPEEPQAEATPETGKAVEEVPKAKEPSSEEEAKPSTAQEEDTEQPVAETAGSETKNSEATDGNSEEDSEEDLDEDEEEEYDYYSQYQGTDRETLYHALLGLNKQAYTRKLEREFRAVAEHYEEQALEAKRQALALFIEKGGEKKDFAYHDQLDERFHDALRIWRDRKSEFMSKQEAERKDNLKAKQAILTKLRDMVDKPQPTTNIDSLRKLQDEWRDTGPVPRADYRELIRNYRALIQRFFDNRSIYFELKDLDRQKNLESKQVIIEKAKTLINLQNINQSIKELRSLHSDYKDIGPVPKGREQELWDNLKAISDTLYERRNEFMAKRDGERQENLKQKLTLVEEVQAFPSFSSDRIDDWNDETKKLLAVQDKWKSIGHVPKEKLREVNDGFWKPFKQFFENKSKFFDSLEAEREANLEVKKELFEEAKALVSNPKDNEAPRKLSQLQKRWRKIGPLPKKHRNIQKSFFKLCDNFYESLRNANKQEEEEQKENLSKKHAVVEKIGQLEKPTEADLKAAYDEYANIGFVPKKDLEKLSLAFEEAFDKAIAAATDIADNDGEAFKMNLRLGLASQSEDARHELDRMKKGLQRKVDKMQEEVDLYRSNLALFSKSKNAEALKNSVTEKLEKQEEQINKLRGKLKAIKDALKPKPKPKKEEEQPAEAAEAEKQAESAKTEDSAQPTAQEPDKASSEAGAVPGEEKKKDTEEKKDA